MPDSSPRNGRQPTAVELAYFDAQGDPALAFASSEIALSPCFCFCRFDAACHCDNYGVCNCPDSLGEDA